MVLFYRAHWRDYKNDQVRIMMNLTTLTHRDALCLNARFTSREEAIHALTQRLAALGKISSTEQFLEEVYRRESLGPTALGEGLAVPHGKTAAVKEAAIAVATLSEPLQWEGVDGPEAVDLVVLLAIPPNEAGTTHMQLLTALTTRLADDEIRARIQSATTPDELLSALDDKGGTQPSASFSNAPTIVCVTACPAGIAHTYMAAEYLEKAGRKLGVNVYVEKQGANGIEGRLTADQLNSATACIFAAEVAIKESERFNGIPALSVPVAEPIRHAEALIQQALTLKRSDETRTVQQDTQPVKSVKTELKQALLSGISFAVPLIVAGGTVLAVAVLLSQIFGLQDLFNEENSWLWMYRKLGGGLLGILMVPVLGTLGAGSLMLFVVGEPVAWINNSLTAWLNGLSGSNALLLGAILGFMCSFDLGGPVNKAAYAFCLGAMANGVYGPYAIFASVKMVSAFTVTASTMLAPRLFKEFEIETGKSTWLLGLAGITEGAIPMAIEDPLRVIGSFVLGSMVTGAIVGAMNIGLSTPGAGIFSLFLLHDNGAGGVMAAIGWFGAALVGAAISTAILLIWRRHAVKHGNYLTDGVMP
ncbi:PTS 2-O-a-mannosyl-D-glycerate transporter subunit IIABC [Escherichia coli]|nr:PTS 2-O-a-mannosyl-D-glycerate transporter subunit IIABC [Escherichia coli]EFI9334263.1 PTS 2-O-a-mannosyl-D-glycerate transporter subunit IIABC [Escherichia coli]EFK4069508.1 PTS 2-O-a-mannosyl-D-glycerate transporter subunit IIABC [Escherichia coli]EFM3659850.1 PTS 2-O-a-mannosyl-D-glycerate transporter subunit IIABC [Escherichia coli]EGE1315007.1 PTS 2-O-a-mannosyl-D-glycerate transporter subunit IIABC [Escherichia coli]